MFAETVSYSAAFAAGLLSFFSPCVLPLIPAYFSFITGMSLEELTSQYDTAVRRKVLVSTVVFILGFSTVFVLLGASASFLGGLTHAYRDAIRIAGGIIIILGKPKSRGRLRLRSKDAREPARIDPHYYEHPEDMETMAPMEEMEPGLHVKEPWARTSPMVDLAGAAYLVIHNSTDADDALVGPARPVDDGDRALLAVERDELVDDPGGLHEEGKEAEGVVPFPALAVLDRARCEAKVTAV